MNRNSQLSSVLHVLLHMAEHDDAMTSGTLAKSLATNPVVIRRTMGALRDQGYVSSEKGHGGGWKLTCDLSKVTLLELHEALGSPTLLAIGNRAEAPGCLIEEAVNAALDQAFQESESLLLKRFGEVTLALLRKDVQKRLGARKDARSCRS